MMQSWHYEFENIPPQELATQDIEAPPPITGVEVSCIVHRRGSGFAATDPFTHESTTATYPSPEAAREAWQRGDRKRRTS